MNPPSIQVDLTGKTILITGAAQRIGRDLALAAARSGADVIIHYRTSAVPAEILCKEIQALGRRAEAIPGDLTDPLDTVQVIDSAARLAPLDFLVNNASVFEPVGLAETSLAAWQQNLALHLTAPFLLSQRFAELMPIGQTGRIINLLDWRALRPGADHFPYTVSKAGLAALTRSLAAALAPRIQVNGLALGAVLAPVSGEENPQLLEAVPAGRWARPGELEGAFLFLLGGPEYITGEILHLDGGRHLI